MTRDMFDDVTASLPLDTPAPPRRPAIPDRTPSIRAAVRHANRVHSAWSDAALAHVMRYINTNLRFTCDAARADAEYHGLPMPPDRRAWGGVMRMAKATGKIRPDGYQMTSTGPKTTWVRCP